LPRPPPDGFPVVLGQFPPGPGWDDAGRPLDLAIFDSSMNFPVIGHRKVRMIWNSVQPENWLENLEKLQPIDFKKKLKLFRDILLVHQFGAVVF